jgi:TP901 family phage tail tape measure protein
VALGVGGTVVARARAILEVDTRGFDRGVAKTERSLVRWNKVAVKASLGVAAGFAILGDKSFEAAKKFDASMELLKTQAGAGQAEVERMKTSVLGLAGSVATAPDELAAGLYHVESAGLRGSRALAVLESAAKGAKIGQANLEDVTNALNATVVSGITGVHSYDEAMGVLNATVGAGDMRMQDLADAMGTGIAAKAKVFGLTIQNVSGALATLGDNNIRGAEAGTQLASAIRLIGAPSKASAKELGKLGWSRRPSRRTCGRAAS